MIPPSLILVLAAVLFPPQDRKLEIPPDASQKEAEKVIKELFKEEYAKRSPIDRQSFARNLLKQAGESKDSAATQYVLFREASDVAARAGDVDLAFRAIDDQSRIFPTPPFALKSAALTLAATAARTAEEHKPIATAALKLSDEAAQARHFDVAVKSSQAAAAAARKGKDLALANRADAQVKSMTALQEKFEKARKSIDVLAAAPDNPEANQAAGEFECFALGDWEAGLPKLAKGTDPVLKALAAKDLARPSDGPELAALGDGWWDRAEKESGLPRISLRQRAMYWYEQASRKLTGLNKVRVDKRLAEDPAQGKDAPNSVDLLALVDLKRDAIRGTWSPSGAGIVSPVGDIAYVQLPYVPGDEYDLTVVAQRKEGGNSLNIGLVVGSGASKHQGMVVLDGGPGGDGSGVGTAGAQGKQMPDGGRAYTVVCLVRKNGVVIQIDGKKILDYQGDLAALNIGSQWVLPAKDALFVGSWTTSYQFSRITVTPVSGPGKKLR